MINAEIQIVDFRNYFIPLPKDVFCLSISAEGKNDSIQKIKKSPGDQKGV